MYVIQGTLPANTFGANLVTDVIIMPAETCIWQISAATDGGYSIDNVYYTQATADVIVSAAQFGSVSKTGRFVKHTV